MSWRERWQHSKWEIISGVLSIALTLWLFNTQKEPEPPQRTWPLGNKPQHIKMAQPPIGKHTCQTEGAPAPVELRFCYAGPDKGLDICTVRLVYVDGKPDHCLVSQCPPLNAKARHYEIMLGCFLERKASR